MMADSAQNIFDAVSSLAGGSLQRPDDLLLIIGSAVNRNKIDLLELLSFNAKFSNGMLKVIRKNESAVTKEYFVKAEEEFKTSLERVRSYLEEILKDEADFIKSILTDKYLQLSHTGLENLSMLCSDLSYLKLFFNDQKESSKKI